MLSEHVLVTRPPGPAEVASLIIEKAWPRANDLGIACYIYASTGKLRVICNIPRFLQHVNL